MSSSSPAPRSFCKVSAFLDLTVSTTFETFASADSTTTSTSLTFFIAEACARASWTAFCSVCNVFITAVFVAVTFFFNVSTFPCSALAFVFSCRSVVFKAASGPSFSDLTSCSCFSKASRIFVHRPITALMKASTLSSCQALDSQGASIALPSLLAKRTQKVVSSLPKTHCAYVASCFTSCFSTFTISSASSMLAGFAAASPSAAVSAGRAESTGVLCLQM
mmetsp:Transcript_141247/g.245978  ORF Transcript_141247/g.245978 Transcript_141247/m.245978 type:complete len:221 (-) Transcript_141247:3843-4505(-)